MKVGDLVTLSAYGLKNGSMWNWRRQVNEGKNLVGIIVDIRKNPYTYSWSTKNEEFRYYIEWCGEGPISRDNGATRNEHGVVQKDYYYFKRNDLRYVK